MRNKFDEQLDKLNGELIAMGALCERAIATSIGALGDRIGTHKIIIAGFIGATILFFLTVSIYLFKILFIIL